ncbi:TerB family tellurite resistance protein [Paraburkholderia caffeinilytica]|uniref:TerB family tellurite resistance protein n=1 Tax=Paraburkholderia caffeinilytica TaxID=1761016 RepID=UPI0038BAC2EB
MRTYPRNSPQAAARIVALALTSDGHVCSSEERVLENLDIAGELGLAPEQFAQIVQALCEDQSVAHTPFAPPVGQLDTALLTTLVNEIDEPALRRKVIRLCLAVAIADDYLADGEIALLAAVFNAWALKPSLAARRRITLQEAVHGHARPASTT